MAGIFEVLNSLAPLKQAGGLGADWSGRPSVPVAVVRYEQPSVALADWLSATVVAFQGQLDWVLDCPVNRGGMHACAPGRDGKPLYSVVQRSWLIYPRRLCEYAEAHNLSLLDAQSSMGAAEPDFGRLATEDLERLAEHIMAAAQRRVPGAAQ
jgi:hypothetical protein